MTDWQPEQIQYLTHAWEELGLTASMIAAKLGPAITKNAVLGKAHRLGLTKRPSPIRRNVKPRPKKARKQASNRPMGPKQPKSFSHKNRGRAYHPAMGGNYKTCQWPMWGHERPTQEFCGAKTKPGQSYCAAHCERAYTKADLRVRV